MRATVRVENSPLLMEFVGWLPILLLLALGSLWLWSLIDACKNPRLTNPERLVWVLVVLFLNWVGAILYLVIARRGRAGGSTA